MQILQVKNIIKDYGSLRALNQVSFDIHPGEIFGLLGPNGAGKTTLISIIMTLEEAHQGDIFICGHKLKDKPELCKSLVGFMPQELIMHGYFNVHEVIEFYCGYCGIWPDKKRVEYLLKRLALWEKRHEKVRSLSGGMKRRMLIAKALIHKPRLVILDEPTAGVDIELRAVIWDFIKELKSQGTSILFTTHYLEEAEELCDRVAVIHHGQIRQIGETRSLISQFTTRQLMLKLKNPTDFKHKQYQGVKKGYSVFLFPKNSNFGQLLEELDLNVRNIEDMRIYEGNLEDAFTKILKD